MATKQKVRRRISYGGSLAVSCHSLFAMSWPLLDLSSPKIAQVHADLTWNLAQDEWAALGKWHLQLNIIKSISQGRLDGQLYCHAVYSTHFRVFITHLIDCHFFPDEVARVVEGGWDKDGRLKRSLGLNWVRQTKWHSLLSGMVGIHGPPLWAPSWRAWVRSLRDSREKGFRRVIESSEEPNHCERTSLSSFMAELKIRLLT